MEQNISGVTQTAAGSEKNAQCTIAADGAGTTAGAPGRIATAPAGLRNDKLRSVTGQGEMCSGYRPGGASTTAGAPGSKEEAFEALIKGQFKQEYDARVQETVRKRLKNAKSAQQTLARLAQKYRITPQAIEKLAQDSDPGEDGLPQPLRDLAMTEERSENPMSQPGSGGTVAIAKDPSEAPAGQGENTVRRQYDIWSAQAQEAKKLYPGFDMVRQLQNPRFAGLLKSGVDVTTAFEVVNRDRILPALMHHTAKTVEKKLTSAMAGARPTESAMESASAALVKTDVCAMSKADRADIIRRVARGEKIRF